MSLQLKTFLALALVGLATAALFAGLGRRVGRSGLRQVIEIEEGRSERSEAALAQGLAHELAERRAREGSFAGAESLLRAFADSSGGVPAMGLFTPDGEVIALGREGLGEIAAMPHETGLAVEVTRVAGGRTERSLAIGGVPVTGPDGGVVAILVPMPDPLALGEDEERSAALGALDRRLLAVAVGVGLLALALSVVLSRRIVRPVEELERVARALGGGELGSRVAVGSRDEIGRLGLAFNEMAAQLERSEAARRRMVSDVAHELRSPLTALRAQLEALEDGLLEPTPEALGSLGEDVRHLGGLVEDLQDLALADAGALRLDVRPLGLRDEVESAARTAPAAPADPARSGHGCDIEIDPSVRVEADPLRLRQILVNLLANAHLHAPGARVTVRAHDVPGGVELTVRDEGPGIPPDDLPHLFDRFWRADGSRTRATGGSGLGLAIVRTLVELHGGSVRAESEPGSGAAFHVVLPRTARSTE